MIKPLFSMLMSLAAVVSVTGANASSEPYDFAYEVSGGALGAVRPIVFNDGESTFIQHSQFLVSDSKVLKRVGPYAVIEGVPERFTVQADQYNRFDIKRVKSDLQTQSGAGDSSLRLKSQIQDAQSITDGFKLVEVPEQTQKNTGFDTARDQLAKETKSQPIQQVAASETAIRPKRSSIEDVPIKKTDSEKPKTISATEAAPPESQKDLKFMPTNRLSVVASDYAKAIGITLKWEAVGVGPGKIRDIVFNEVSETYGSGKPAIVKALRTYGFDPIEASDTLIIVR